MDKKYALLISVILTIIIASDTFLFSLINKDSDKEKVVVMRVIDGDTIQLEDGRIVRLLNINSPEKGKPGSAESTSFLKQYENSSIQIEITGTDKYFRNLARLYSPDYLNLLIVQDGFASKFLVDPSELKLFSNAEAKAINNSYGIWKKSDYFGCFNSKIDSKKEIVTISNTCNEINLSGWMLKDESRKIYVFKSSIKDKLIIHTGVGKDNETDYFWNSNQNIWNDDRDTLYLFDSEGKIVHSHDYGY